jgi:two-component system chemotaxis response regulator CheB
MTIKVMILNDSSVVRQVLQELLESCGDISVIATVSDPALAMAQMRMAWPDVMVLDMEMPRMDGLMFLRQIMAIRPTPVLICFPQGEHRSSITTEALAAGAIGVIPKPALGIRDFLHDRSQELIAAVRSAAMMSQRRLPQTYGELERLSADVMLDPPGYLDGPVPLTARIIAIGASTGGPQALEVILGNVAVDCPGLVIVQHMPEKFTCSFAKRLNTMAPIQVKEAEHHDLVLPGRALVAPGGSHLMVRRNGMQYYVEVASGPSVSRHKPSVDVLFRSVARAAGKNAVGIIMTGMGDDGAHGMKELHDCGAATYAQDEASCVVFGMPKEAISLGGVGTVVSLERISSVIDRYGR